MSLSSLRGAIVPIGLLVLWEILSRAGIFSPIVLPPPSAVATKWVAGLIPAFPYEPGQQSYLAWLFSGEMPHDAVASLARVLSGFCLGAGLAVPAGLLLGSSDRLFKLFNPLLEILRPIPPIAYIPLAIVWFGLGNPPALFLIALGTFFPVLVNTIAGVRQVDSIYIRAARNLGANSWTMFRRVILPAASPFVLAGMRIGIGTAFIVVIVAEMIAVSDGLGYRILEAREYMWSDKIIGGMLTIGVLGLIIDGGMSRLNDHLLRWHRGLER
ncbi:ABC transporter permease [Methylobacterium nigriterrae]|uniref:ABC transporter permease n=1 Tax=Methylobacterium nigriterrae TaxID=3127512 RepID=UPI0030136E6D